MLAFIGFDFQTLGAASPRAQAREAEVLRRFDPTRDCHLIEIDLIRRGRHVVCIPQWRVRELKMKPFDCLCCVNRWPMRNRFELYARRPGERLPRLKAPLAEGDPDITLDLQAALEQVYVDGRYYRRIRYDQKCKPRLTPQDQAWADQQMSAYRAAHPDFFMRKDVP